MFGSNRKSPAHEIVSLDLHITSSGNKPITTITRNRIPRGRRRAGMNLYHRADQFLMKLRAARD